jgi:protein TonB
MILASPDTLVISARPYGAYELKKIIRMFTLRGFYYVCAFLVLSMAAVFVFASREKKVYKTPYRSSARIDMIDTPPASQDAAPPPPPPEVIVQGTVTQAGNPVPVPDALVAPDQVFASVNEISTSSSQVGDNKALDINDLPTDQGISVAKESEPDADEFIVTDQDYNEIISRILPDLQRRVVYPEMARRAGVEGRVSVKVLIGKDGRPKPGRVIIEETASELLNKAAIDAIMQQVFPPATQNSQPVEVWVVIPIVFRLR